MKSGFLSVNKYSFSIQQIRPHLLFYSPVEEYKNDFGEVITNVTSADDTFQPSYNLNHFKVVPSKSDSIKFHLNCKTLGCLRFGKKHKVTLYAQSKQQRTIWLEQLNKANQANVLVSSSQAEELVHTLDSI